MRYACSGQVAIKEITPLPALVVCFLGLADGGSVNIAVRQTGFDSVYAVCVIVVGH
jgi:hypothetical protein